MTDDEITTLMNNLPEILPYTGSLGGECLAFTGTAAPEYEILLETGQVIKSNLFVRVNGMKNLKDAIKTKLNINRDSKFLGKGVIHRF